ncbi:hypothetical protein F5884DRAFT_821520 [Xylogone sp. PMI_703]|nr:hypothetical protein F5884DRAFT_821520 [Xylogone sp. PMI_703]
MLGLLSLPYELLTYVVADISFDDVYNLGCTCRALQFLLKDESLCMSIAQSKIQYSKEAQMALASGRGYASAVRRVAKRRLALTSVKPFLAATIGFADAYIYCNGVLCYTLDDRIRIFDLHNSGSYEIVIQIPKLLSHALHGVDDSNRGLFQVLYYSDDIVSCLYTPSGEDATPWLIAFNPGRHKVLLVHDLDSSEKIFVRHNSEFLYFGTHSGIGTDGYKRWVITGYDFRNKRWFEYKIHLTDLVGSEIGSTVCFEFYDGYFYALSNQTSFEVEEIDWTSFYHCVRFPLASPCPELCEKTEDERMWRRQHQEGPIDDRWTNLRLDIDEATGEMRIIESRKEWYQGSSKSQRTYYTTNIDFRRPPSINDTAIATNSTDSTSASFEEVPSSQMKHNLSALPNDPIVNLLAPEDHPNHLEAPPRLPQNTHPGDDGSLQLTFTLTKSRLRYYNTSSSTFLDLVDDPLPTDWQQTQRIRLRCGSRKPAPPLQYPAGHRNAGVTRPPSNDLSTALKELYLETPITFWPSADLPESEQDAIYKLLNPPSHLGNVEGTADDRSLVYVTGGTMAPQALIFISFDPAIRLEGLKKFGQSDTHLSEDMNCQGRTTAKLSADVEEDHRTVILEHDRKGKRKADSGCVTNVQATKVARTSDFGVDVAGNRLGNSLASKRWASREKPMYVDIDLGYYFGR